MRDYVPYQLAILSNRLSRALEEVFGEDHGLARPEWRVLALASETETCRASDLVPVSGMDAVAIHRAVKRLEELGLVERVSAGQDRRARPIRVTEAGRAVYASVVPHALTLERRLLASLERGEADVLKQALKKLMAAEFSARPGPR